MRSFFSTVALVGASLAMTTGIVAFADPANACIAPASANAAAPTADRAPDAQVGLAVGLRIPASAERMHGADDGGSLMHPGSRDEPIVRGNRAPQVASR